MVGNCRNWEMVLWSVHHKRKEGEMSSFAFSVSRSLSL